MGDNRADLALQVATGEVANDTQARNAAACEHAEASIQGPATPISPSDSKRSHAAALARELASSTSWSESFVPSNNLHHDPEPTGSENRTLEEMNKNNNPGDGAVTRDPPPAYTNHRDLYELPATPVMPQTARRATSHQAQNDFEDMDEQHTSADPAEAEQQPLISRSDGQPSRRGWTPWIHRGKTTRKRFCRLVSLVIAFSILASALMCVLTGAHHRSNGPSAPIATFAPTGPNYELHKMTGNINGRYKLYDRLELTTTTGTIDVEIEPDDGDRPAILILSTATGAINLRVSRDYVNRKHKARRTIFTNIKTLTGTVNADILVGHGGSASVKTNTGSQSLSIMTFGVGPKDAVSNLTTSSGTGSQQVALSSLDLPNAPITNLQANHHGLTTATLNIQYPAQWYGEIHAVSMPMGNVHVQGRDLVYTKNGEFEVIAHRGSYLNTRTIKIVSEGTGSIQFSC